MTRDEVAGIVHSMPQGMDADDYLVELVNRAVAIEREACAKVCENMERNGAWITKEEAAAAIRANRSLATTSAGKPNYCTPQVTPQVTPEVTGNVDLAKVGEVGVWGDSQALAEPANSTTDFVEPKASSQTKQKPVAWLEPEWGEKICPEVGFEATTTSDHPRDLCWTPLYAHPPQNTAQAYLKGFDEGCKSMSARNGDTTGRWSGKIENIGSLGMPVNVPVTPPQRTWVGLTRRELDIATLGLEDLGDCYLAIEAKLKEKNT